MFMNRTLTMYYRGGFRYILKMDLVVKVGILTLHHSMKYRVISCKIYRHPVKNKNIVTVFIPFFFIMESCKNPVETKGHESIPPSYGMNNYFIKWTDG